MQFTGSATNSIHRLRTCILLALLFASGAPAGVCADEIDFEKQIRPLLQQRCGDCHGPDEQESGLRLDVRKFAFKGGDGGPVISPGSSDKSELVHRITSSDEDTLMPPGEKLPAAEIQLLKKWIDAGARWPETAFDREQSIDHRLKHWAYQPVKPLTAAQHQQTDQQKAAEIDRLLAAKRAAHGLTISPPADRRTLIRRLTLDLHGLPPTPAEVAAFVSSKDPDSYAKLQQRLLASPRYGERWGQHWLDVVRYADTHGFEVNTPRDNAWPYRDYVIAAFNEDKPYDQFLHEQLVGDTTGKVEATGFLVTAAALLPGQIGKDAASKRLARQDELDEMIVGFSGAMLGMTIGCARCHDHKFDPVSAGDYYALQAFFAGVKYGERAMQTGDQPQKQQRIAQLEAEKQRIDAELQQFQPLAFTGRTITLDETSPAAVSLYKPNGPGRNPAGKQRGHLNDVGSATRAPNLSGGSYLWWDNRPGEDVLTYQPGVAGSFRLWLSWGVHGSGVHTRDARYLLDADGDLKTLDDQQPLATIDQYYPAGVTRGKTPLKPLWSGLHDAGLVQLSPGAKIVLRGGKTGTGITADVIVLQEESSVAKQQQPALPVLRDPVSPVKNVERFAPTQAKFVRFTTLATIDDNRHQPCIDELEIYATGGSRNLAKEGAATSSGNYGDNQGSHKLQKINDGVYGNGSSWISNQYGGGWVQIELPLAQSINRIVWGRDRNGKYADRLASAYRIETSVDGKTWQLVASHEDRLPRTTPASPAFTRLRHQPAAAAAQTRKLTARRAEITTEIAQLSRQQMVFAGLSTTPGKTFALRRGDPEQPLEETLAAVPALFGVSHNDSPGLQQQPASDIARRTALARWVTSPQNPLPARVMVNRIWQHHFGQGLVKTPNDFGLNGGRPSHPELLDYLAAEFVASGWSVKHMHRLICSTATYRQSHQINPAARQKDRGNRYLWRYPSRRMEAEALRDSMLAISGELNLKMGGRGYDLFQSRGGTSGFKPIEQLQPQHLRRMIYAHKVRMEPAPVFGAFDCPDAGQPAPVRSRSTTAVQALNLFNSRFVVSRAQSMAATLEKKHPQTAAAITQAFQLAYGRNPTPEQLQLSASIVKQHGLATLCRALLNSNEFVFIP